MVRYADIEAEEGVEELFCRVRQRMKNKTDRPRPVRRGNKGLRQRDS